MLDDLLRKTLENTPKEYKKNMIDSFRINIGKLINNTNDYIDVEEKIYNAESKAGYSVSYNLFYMSLQHRINIQLLKEIVNALNNVDELEKFKKLEEIYKELVTRKEEIEAPNSRWKNANKYKEPNNPDLQTRINQILENGPNAKEESINENINTIINYLKVEEKIYNAEKNAGYIIAGTPFYMSTYSDITKLISAASTAIKDEDEIRKIKKYWKKYIRNKK
ncbi:hypothetical protein [Spiroplasma endosymbiont of Dactylopius coccus]|nr:hypothetical protein [Spiroplasma ixodetis]